MQCLTQGLSPLGCHTSQKIIVLHDKIMYATTPEEAAVQQPHYQAAASKV